MSAPRIFAWNDIKDHKVVYGVIIAVIALTMTSFMLINASQMYTEQVISRTTKMAISSDACILAPGSDLRDLYGGAAPIADAQRIADVVIERLPGYKASVRCTLQATYNVGDGFDGCVIQGIDLQNDPEQENIKSCMVGGEWFDPEADYLHHHLSTRLDVGDLTEKVRIGETQLGRMAIDMSKTEDEPYPVVIGVSATRVHPIQIGDIIPITGTTGGGRTAVDTKACSTAVALLRVRVIGTYESATPALDEIVWFMPVQCLRELKGYGTVTSVTTHQWSPLFLDLEGLTLRVDRTPLVARIANSLLSRAGDVTLTDVGSVLDSVVFSLDSSASTFTIDPSIGDVVIVRSPEPSTRLNDIGYAERVKADLAGVVISSVPGTTQDYTIYSGRDLIRYVTGSMGDISTIMSWGMIAIILLLAGFAIYHAMSSVVVRKTREIGSLKAFGATNGVVLCIFLYQALFIGILAGGLGVCVAIGAIHLINWFGGVSVGFIGQTQLDIGFLVAWYMVIITFLVPVVVSVAASLLPARKAARLSPVEALRKGEMEL